MNTHDFAAEAAAEAAKGAPPVVVAAGGLLGLIDLNTIVALATLTYVVLQSAYLLWKWRLERKGVTFGKG